MAKISEYPSLFIFFFLSLSLTCKIDEKKKYAKSSNHRTSAISLREGERMTLSENDSFHSVAPRSSHSRSRKFKKNIESTPFVLVFHPALRRKHSAKEREKQNMSRHKSIFPRKTLPCGVESSLSPPQLQTVGGR